MDKCGGKNKILLIAFNDLGLGGIQNVIMNIVRNLSDVFLFDIVCRESNNDIFEAEFKAFGGQIFRLGKNKNHNFILTKLGFYFNGKYIESRIKKIIGQNGPYLAIHCHKENESGRALSAAKKCGIPIRIAHAHTAFDGRYNPIAKLYISHLRKLIYKNATDMIACSEKAGEKLFGDHPYKVIYNTIDKRFFEQKRPTTVSHSAPRLLQVGTICDNKNQAFSVDVLKSLKEFYPEATLTFIGAPKDGRMRAYFDDLIDKSEDLGIYNDISFLPSDSDVLKELNKSDYLIFPSKFEGLGIVPIEAQSQGMKCFVSRSVSDEVDCGGCVFLDLNAGSDVWAKRIADRFALDHGERKEYDLSRFMPDVIMEQYRKIYEGENN